MADPRDPNRPPVQAYADTNGIPPEDSDGYQAPPPLRSDVAYQKVLARLTLAEDLLASARHTAAAQYNQVDAAEILSIGLSAEVNALQSENNALREEIEHLNRQIKAISDCETPSIAGELFDALGLILSLLSPAGTHGGAFDDAIFQGERAIKRFSRENALKHLADAAIP
jgi:cell division protein FtsB